ncbi:MAG: beta-N-acetylglucosaminidase domain-containing protein [Brevibacillus sp.]|nr:beta-N-acetylglucosaminidase domain-containing protein [Brevibacillus sp.]
MSITACFSLRGVIEGFYGKPWSQQERLGMIPFLAAHRYNAYFYSPKDDPYLREHWQEPHPPTQLDHFRELIALARENGLMFFFCLSPGLQLEYGSEAHFARLVEKYRQLFELGCRHFALLFDDIPMALMHPDDRRRFAHLAEAQVDITRRLWQVLGEWMEEPSLVICPTQYHGLGNEPYIVYLGQHLPKEIPIFWTGRFVCSPYLTEGDAQFFARQTGRRPLIWDNYPVNDLGMADELHIGPLLNRDPGLYRHVSGFVSNVMELAESSKIPLITVAEYLVAPEQYDSEAAWRRAIGEVIGEEDTASFLMFADNVRGSFLNDREAPRLMETLLQFRYSFLYGDRTEAVRGLQHFFREMEQNASRLLAGMRNQRLAREVRRWLVKYWHWAKVGLSATALIEEGIKGRTARAAFHLLGLKRLLKKTERIPAKVCGNVMKLFVGSVLQEATRRGYTARKQED